MAKKLTPVALDLPLFGRSTSVPQHTEHVFGTVTPNGGLLSEEVTLPLGAWSGNPRQQGADDPQVDASLLAPRLWHVRMSGKSITRNPGAGLVTPLDPSSVGEPPPAGVQVGGTGWLKAEVALRTQVGFKRFFMDVGESIEFYGTGAALVGLRGAVGMALVTPTNFNTLEASGLVLDARVGCEIVAIEVPLGRRTVRFTQHVAVLISTQVSIDVPRFAKSVAVYQSTAGVAAGAWDRQVGAGAGGTILGTLDFTGRSSRLEDRPIGDETVLRTDLDNAAARLFTLVWEIEP